MGELERNMRDDVGQPQGNAPSTDNGRQMDMFVDERQRVSHRRGAIARGVAKRGLVAFLAFAMAFGTTPAQLWADGAEGIAEAAAQAVAQGETGSDGAVSAPAEQGNASASDSGVAATGTSTSGAAAGDDGSATGESSAASSTRARRLRTLSLNCSRRRASRQITTRTRHTVSTSRASRPRPMAARLPSIRRLMPSGSCSSTARLPRLARAASSSPRVRRLSLPIRLVARPLSLRIRLPQM